MFNLRVTDKATGIVFDCRRDNMEGKKEWPDPVPYSPDGKVLSKKMIGSTKGKMKWMDDQGNWYDGKEVVWKIGEEIVRPIKMTGVFEVIGYKPLDDYMNRYIIDKFYELFAYDGEDDQPEDREILRSSNLVGMRKLWEKLNSEKVLAAGYFNAGNGGFKAGIALIRAVNEPGNKWGLELCAIKEEKVFRSLQEGIPQVMERKKEMKSDLL